MCTNLFKSRYWSGLILLVITWILVSCASGPSVVDHAFGFDTRWDSPGVEVLDYRYGSSQLSGVHTPDWMLKDGKSPQMANTNGPMRVGDSLYVKWRIKSTGEIFQDTVDLQHLLPNDIKGHRIYFIVKGSQLYVYLISPERRPQNIPPNGPHGYDHLKTITLYPNQPTK